MYSSEPMFVGTPAIPTGQQIASIPLGNFAQAPVTASSIVLNGDTITNGVTATGFATMTTLLFFPYSDVYQLQVNAFYTNNVGYPGNSIQVYVDWIPAAATTQTIARYWAQFVSNAGPAQAYLFTTTVIAGWHWISVRLNTASGPATPIPCGVHGDRIIVSTTGQGILAEPAGNVDPFQYPTSALSPWKTALGSAASWSNAGDADTLNLTGTALCAINSTALGPVLYQGQNTDPVGMVWISDQTAIPVGGGVAPPKLNSDGQFIRIPAGTTLGTGGLTWSGTDANNPRYAYQGRAAAILGSNAQPIINLGGPFSRFIDNYNTNPPIDQDTAYHVGILRLQEIASDGVIAHALNIGMATQKLLPGDTTITGNAWPNHESDAQGPFSNANPQNYTGPILYGSRLGIPASTSMPGGLSLGGQMLFTCLQNYGGFINLSGGQPSDEIFLLAEPSLVGNALFTGMSNDWTTLVPLLRILRNQAPPLANGGGSPRVGTQSGLRASLAPLQLSSTVPSPAGFPYQIAAQVNSKASGTTIITSIDAPVGSTLLLLLGLLAGNTGQFTTVTDSVGNVWSVAVQSAATQNCTAAIACCVNSTKLLPAGSTITVNFTGGAGNGWSGIAYGLVGAIGGLDKVASAVGNAPAPGSASVSTNTLAQTREFAVGVLATATGVSFPSLVEGLGGLEMFDGSSHGAAWTITASTIGVGYNTSWNAGASTPFATCIATFKMP